jgi:hypothetical protein
MSVTTQPDFGYLIFYGKQKIQLYAKSLLDAKELGIQKLKVPATKRHMVTVVLAEVMGKPVVQSTVF